MKIKVMTFNLRVDNQGDGKNSFFHRTDRIARVLKEESPELVGFQEVTDGMRRWIVENIGGYVFQGCGRNSDCHGESMLLAYKKDVYELISLENRWLSDTPEVPGSRYGGDQSSCPRMFTSLKLMRNGVDKPIVFINTHLDHIGKNARIKGAKALSEYVQGHIDRNCTVILTGDFNATPDTAEIKLMSEGTPGMHDCTAQLGGTFHSFGALSPERQEKIDYIFSNETSDDARVIPDAHADGIYYSDHYAVTADIVLK